MLSFFQTPILALTATTTIKVKQDIMTHLHLRQPDTDIVSRLPDRPNIFLDVTKKVKQEPEEELKWLVDHIKEKGTSCKKILIYCRSLDMVSRVYLDIKDALGSYAFKDQTRSIENSIVEMFHKLTEQEDKDRILHNIKKVNSTIRVVVCTEALGMGIDIPNISLVVHFGSPKSMLSYWQQVGRCVRDQSNGYALAIYDGHTLSQKTTKPEMKDVMEPKEMVTCIRKVVLTEFALQSGMLDDIGNGTECEESHDDSCDCKLCSCCFLCRQRCPCNKKINFSVETFLNM